LSRDVGAPEGSDKVWLSTSDGIRRLDRADERNWRVSDYREYYEGHPSFVSRAYIPGEDAVRLWGCVDARSVAEINSGIVLIGVDDQRSGRNGLRRVTWDGKKVEPVAGPEDDTLDIFKLPNGQIVAASWWDLCELDAAGNGGSGCSWESSRRRRRSVKFLLVSMPYVSTGRLGYADCRTGNHAVDSKPPAPRYVDRAEQR
jgi:hypothetical protein